MYNPQLETFLCVVEAGSFNKAAEKLYISPPAVIKQINLLEDSLALQLFVRTHRGASSDRSREVPISGCKVYYPILQGFGDTGKNAMQESEKRNPYRHLAHDPRTGIGEICGQSFRGTAPIPSSNSFLLIIRRRTLGKYYWGIWAITLMWWRAFLTRQC